ncbi:RCC1 domain-containing protein [Hymenobacter arcticus]
MLLSTSRTWALLLGLLLIGRLAVAQHLAVGGGYTLAVHDDGTLWAWGSNTYGQAGLATSYQPTPAQVGAATTWRQVAAGGYCSLGVRTNGTLWAWGSNTYGQLGYVTASTYGQTSPTQVGTATTWKSVSVGTNHTLAVRTDGTLWSWGNNRYGQLGTGTTLPAGDVQATPVQVGTATTWASVQASSESSLALRTDGTLWSWGYNLNGQLGLGTTTDQYQPTQVGTATTWKSMSVGTNHALAIRTDGTLWTWGSNTYGQLGTGTTNSANAPVQVGTATTWQRVSAGYSHSLAIRTDGSLWAWGYNYWSMLGVGNMTTQLAPVAVGAGAKWQEVSTGPYTTLALRADGSLWAWGYNAFGQFGDGSGLGLVPTQVGTATNWKSASLYTSFTAAVRQDGTLWTWGNNTTGRLGTNQSDKTLGSRAVPTQVGTATTWQQAAAGEFHALALRADGTLYGWGRNNEGQLGLGYSLVDTYSPTYVSGGWALTAGSFATGDFHTLALRPDGTLWSCGFNRDGQLGDGGLAYQRTVLGQVGTASNWKSVAVSGSFSLALKTDGTLWSWGDNTFGQLGDGTTTDGKVPAQVGTATNWVAMSAGQNYALGLRADGTLWAWGYNGYGQLGTSGTSNPRVPSQVGTATTWQSVAAGYSHSLAIRTDGTLWAWGQNNSGQLGLGTVAYAQLPTQVGTGTSWQQVAVDENHTVAVRQDGTLWSWGNNGSGQLGRLNYAALPTLIASGGAILATTATASVAPAWSLFPNPAHDQVQLRGLPTGPLRVRVLDAQGRLVRTASEATVSTQGLAPGLYLLQAAAAGQPVRTQRLVVE